MTTPYPVRDNDPTCNAAAVTDEPWPGPDADPLDLSQHDEAYQRHITALGLIAAYTNLLDAVGRWLLHLAIGSHVSQQQMDALFVGDRLRSIRDRFNALKIRAERERERERADGDGDGRDPDSEARYDAFMTEAFEWFMTAGKLTERRDALMHRPIQLDFVEGRGRHTLLPSRRSQVSEDLDERGTQLVNDLENLVEDGWEIGVRHRVELRR